MFVLSRKIIKDKLPLQVFFKPDEEIVFDVNVFTLASSLLAVRRDDCLRGVFLLNTIFV